MQRTRRDVLKAAGITAAAASTAGCLTEPGDALGSTENEGYANFFAVWDWAEHVGGEHFSFENPVETGQMGHGWSPDGNITGEIASSNVFFYIDTPEFSWAQDVARQLEQDYDDVPAVDLLDGLDPFLISYDGGEFPSPDPAASRDPEDLLFNEFDIYDVQAGQQLGYWHNHHWHGGVPDVLLDASRMVGVVVEDTEGRVLPLGEDQEYRLDARIAEGEDEIVEIESLGDRVVFHGKSLGQTAVVFEFYRNGERFYDTADEPSPFSVVETIDGDGADETHDPHVWIDPPLVDRMVDTIADSLAELDPDNAAAYHNNADGYSERIMEVHEELEAIADSASHSEAVFAAHDSFSYVERRYGLHLRTPTGVTPDASASIEEISGLIEIIERNGLDTVLYDPFESPEPGERHPQLVQLIFENTDVDRAEPLTPVEGTTQAWADNDWGWVEQMQEINLPSLRAAFDA